MHYIVLDLEFNQSFPFKTGIKTTPVAECPFEIIQIGAVKLNEQFEILEQFNTLITPQIYTRLHPFVEKITHIQEADLQDQPKFPQAYHDFLQFIGKEPAVLCTWGPDDVKSLFRNILYHQLSTDALTHQYINIQPFASQYLNQEPGKAIGLKNAVMELGIPITDDFHNALYDAIYTAKILQIVHPSVMTPNIFHVHTLLTTKVKQTKTDKKALYQHFMTMLNRELSESEKKLIKSAYKLGKNLSFECTPPSKKPTKSKK